MSHRYVYRFVGADRAEISTAIGGQAFSMDSGESFACVEVDKSLTGVQKQDLDSVMLNGKLEFHHEEDIPVQAAEAPSVPASDAAPAPAPRDIHDEGVLPIP